MNKKINGKLISSENRLLHKTSNGVHKSYKNIIKIADLAIKCKSGVISHKNRITQLEQELLTIINN